MKTFIKLLLFVSLLIFLVAIVTKVYFIPKIDQFTLRVVKNKMTADARAFERIITTVVTAAGTDKNVVRKALVTIGSDPKLNIKIRRSEAIQRQYGRRPEKSIIQEKEILVASDGKPRFMKTDENLEYIYPLKAKQVCVKCHVTTKQEPIKSGYILGLVVHSAPKDVLAHEERFLVFDIFWQNFIFFSVLLLLLLVVVFFWFSRPTIKLERRATALLDEYHHEVQNDENVLESALDELEQRHQPDKDSR